MLAELAAARGVAVTHRRLAVRDRDVPSGEEMTEILDAIDGAQERGEPTYVHCWGGHGRTGTVVGCYLARHGLARGDAALERITELRRQSEDAGNLSPQTPEQCGMVRGWR